jgi:ubiquinone/menaquinone biosynthesis C-methylase UbiE
VRQSSGAPAGYRAKVDERTRIELATTFDRAAELYDRVRPGFAASALEWVLPVGARRVLDLGAGTGKLTEALVARGLDVVAIDPAPNMLARLRDKLPDVDARVATSEATGLPDGDVDAVVVGSAFHWFARPDAEREMARVLRPGGVVGLLWNLRDPASPTVRAFHEAQAHATETMPGEHADVTLDPRWFGPTQHRQFPHTQELAPDQLVELVASRSYVIAMAEPERTHLLDRVRRFVDTSPALAGRATFDLPYLTLVRRASVRSPPLLAQ